MVGKQTTIYLSDDQAARIAKLPRDVSFSKLIRDKFDIIMEGYEEKRSVNMVTR